MFIWDEAKKRKVIESYQVDFAFVFDIFEDAFSFDFEDDEHSTETETRWGIIGQTANTVWFF